MTTPDSPYGFATDDTRRVLVHVVSPEGWSTRDLPGHPESLWPEHREPRTVHGAWAMCGTGLDTPADWPNPAAGQKWCPRCVDPARRELELTRV
ncbi:hypothetical protein [Streptomyces sp. MP131-18]|uniref:hypothetical protein n=1 Tax=Streptomyces sp. MP131-18 TaxID=1857892 RepID=UPI00097C1ADF|nr:hypothetical protein [Streptomyces sp. MP131-18]ONK13271.1 hypothetical protein STBA_40340 [Streptomyces sp. MP131-18]